MSRMLRFFGLVVLATVALGLPAAPAAAGGGCHETTFTDVVTDEVKAVGACFMPAVARVDAGETVTWFGDEMDHTVTGVAGEGVDADLGRNGKVSATFDKEGVYPYACVLHPGMVGAIVVGDGGTGAAQTNAAPTRSPGDAGPVAVAAVAVAALAALGLRRVSRRRAVPVPVSTP